MLLSLGVNAAERGLVPDAVTRMAIRRLCRIGRDERRPDGEFFDSLVGGPIALDVEKANEQHYELPAEFFANVLGPRMKYSCCQLDSGIESLVDAEVAALETTCERAGIRDGQRILELGCGWGSLSCWMAERFPGSSILAASNSAHQRRFIESKVREKGLGNLQVVTADMNAFEPAGLFDRVVSVEMFEHMRNFDALMARIAHWLKPDGRLFVHHFCHRNLAYPFETAGDSNWMGRHFFTGGLMPSEHLLRRFDNSLVEVARWKWSGKLYQRTAEAWLKNLDARREAVLPVLESAYGRTNGRRWFHRWRMFFLAVAELFGFAGGEEWFVAHALFARNDARRNGTP